MKSLGQTAYEAYSAKTNGKSLVSGKDLPNWNSLSPAIKGAWDAAAIAVRKKQLEEGGDNHES